MPMIFPPLDAPRKRRVKRWIIEPAMLLKFFQSLNGMYRHTTQGLPEDAQIEAVYTREEGRSIPNIVILLSSATFEEVAADGYPAEIRPSIVVPYSWDD